MPSYLDLGLILIVLVSALLSMLRGFTREVLAIASWAAAAAAAFYGYPYVLPYVQPHIAKEQIAMAVSAAGVFFATLIVVSIVTVKLSDAILDSKVGALDRSLGFVFGAGRGFLLCVVAFVFFAWLVPEKGQPGWVRNARTKPFLEKTGEQLMAVLPDDPEGMLAKFKKKRGGAADEPPSEPDVEQKPAAPRGSRTDAAPAPTSGIARNDRQGLDQLLRPSAAPSTAPTRR